MYDVIIIGAGVTGTACARELSRYEAKICVLEKEEDVCCGTSKANSAIVHAGYDAAEGSLKAKLNVRGNLMMEELSEKLDFPFKRNGSLVICLHKEDFPKLETLYERGKKNGVKGLQILYREQVKEMEPNITDEVYAALYAPSAGIVCPFAMNLAFAENAVVNGAEFRFDTEVQNIRKTSQGWEIETSKGVFLTKTVINAAGVYADRFHNMVSEKKLCITPRRGSYCLHSTVPQFRSVFPVHLPAVRQLHLQSAEPVQYRQKHPCFPHCSVLHLLRIHRKQNCQAFRSQHSGLLRKPFRFRRLNPGFPEWLPGRLP